MVYIQISNIIETNGNQLRSYLYETKIINIWVKEVGIKYIFYHGRLDEEIVCKIGNMMFRKLFAAVFCVLVLCLCFSVSCFFVMCFLGFVCRVFFSLCGCNMFDLKKKLKNKNLRQGILRSQYQEQGKQVTCREVRRQCLLRGIRFSLKLVF